MSASSSSSPPKVLLVTGSLVSPGGTASVASELRKQVAQYRASSRSMLDVKVKLTPVEIFLAHALARTRGDWGRHAWGRTVAEYFAEDVEGATPTLTEVVLSGELERAGLAHTSTTFGDLFADRSRREALLATHECLFLSTTLVRDLSELEPIVALVKRPGNRVVLGGALVGLVYRSWRGMDGVDALAVGYGERLVPGLAAWIRSGYRLLPPSPDYAVEHRGRTLLVHGTKPADRSLDELPTPDWGAWARRSSRSLRMVRYESVRGCPYRCAFCNFPFLFDDETFRTKSARRIADEWEWYRKELGVEWVSCFDSLFTVPRARMRELCGELVRRKLDLKWICYARGDDLVQDGMLPLMRDAGLAQVHVGADSGSQAILDAMDKRCTVEKNRDALRACRALGVSSIVTLIVGYPGETRATAEATYRFVAESEPDFYLLALLNTRMEGVPLLEPEARRRFRLEDWNDGRTNQPFFRHATMDAVEAMGLVEELDERIRRERRSLWAPLFMSGTPTYRLDQRGALLEYQQHLATVRPWLHGAFGAAHRLVDKRLVRQVAERWSGDAGDGGDAGGLGLTPIPLPLSA